MVDDQQGFLQAMINPRSQTFCRLLFGSLLLTHRSLAFGLTKSPSIFQWLNRVAVSALNRRGFTTLLYLDDRLIKEKLLRSLEDNETTVGGYSLFCLLVAFGGFISMGKSHFKPVRQGRFLGFDFDTEKMIVSVPREKHTKTIKMIKKFKEGLVIHGVRYYDMKLLEKIRGKIMSWMLVCENWGFFTREMNYTLKIHMARFEGPRAETELMTMADVNNLDELFDELDIWVNLDYVHLSRPFKKETHITSGPLSELYTDASGGGLGSALPHKKVFKLRKFALPLWLSGMGIHVKEAYAIYIAIDSYGLKYYNQRIVILCDNVAVCESWNGKGARDVHLARVLKKLRQKCADCKISLTLKWVSTDKQEADQPSREISHVFARLKRFYGQRLQRCLGVNLDLFADPGNVLVNGMRFYSEYTFSGRAGLDGMSYLNSQSDDDVVYAYPPRVLSGPFLKVRLKEIVRKLTNFFQNCKNYF